LENATFSLAKPAAQVDPVDIEGPSAADYDPINDRKLDEKHREEKELPSFACDKTTPADNSLDMFADDDMFADPPLSHPLPTLKPSIPLARQLDERLLDNWDDAEGYYRVIMGELVDGRYVVNANLGKGMFSTVVKVTENLSGKQYAIKIVRNNESMRKAGIKEIGILKKLMEADPDDRKHIIRMDRHFDHKSHLCIVFESSSINLREVLKKFGRDVGINLKAVNEARNVLKICDLGSASDASENDITPYLVSRFYRAPEIILGLPYDFSLDVWSIGCTLYELYSGKILFPGRSNNQMLKLIMECRGRFNNKFLKKGDFTHLHFDEQFNFQSSELDRHTGKILVKTCNFSKPVKDLKSKLIGSNSPDLSTQDLKLLNNFVDFLDKCLNLLPEKRITPKEALIHPFIRG
ncbi:Serine/threonine-protein kinase prp4, partial [Neolecta irregularis DAH-3]